MKLGLSYYTSCEIRALRRILGPEYGENYFLGASKYVLLTEYY
jgi:hypothetical protein